jgi:aspartyl protease family protein
MNNTLRALALTLGLALPYAVLAQSVALTGMLGAKALVIVDGSPPKALAPGETFKGVKIVSTQGNQAVVEIDGEKQTLRIGEAPVSVGSKSGDAPSGNRVVLTAADGGHFFTLGQINGQSAQMVVDTGASSVALSAVAAQRMGIDYRTGQPIQMSTANGVIPGWRVKLASVRVGDVVVRQVDGVVSSGAMPYVLLGNTFLTHFQMTRTNDQMVLEKRY